MTFIISLAITLLILSLFFWLVAHRILSGSDLSLYDSSIDKAADQIFGSHPDDPEYNKKTISQLTQAHLSLTIYHVT